MTNRLLLWLSLINCSTALAAELTFSGDVYEVLYYNRAIDERVRIGAVGPVKFDAQQPSGFGPLVKQIVAVADKTASPGRPPITFSLSEARGKGVRKAVVYEMHQQVKGSTAQAIDFVQDLNRLDSSRIYSILPLISGYECSVATLSKRNSQWVLRDETDDKEVGKFSCNPKSRADWTIDFDIEDAGSGLHPYEPVLTKLQEALYDAVESAAKSDYPNLRSFRQELIAEREWLQRNGPAVQAAYSRKLNFAIKGRVSK